MMLTHNLNLSNKHRTGLVFVECFLKDMGQRHIIRASRASALANTRPAEAL